MVESTQKSVTNSELCGCTISNSKLTNQCEYHKQRDVLIQNRAALFIESRIKVAFKGTHLREMQEKVLVEVHKLYKGKYHAAQP